MSGDVKMEPCPFCGCDPVLAYSSGSVSGVRCPQCDARTGYCDQQQAIAAWNRRSSRGMSVEVVGRAIAAADGEDYMEDCERYDKRARFAIKTCGLAVKP